MSTARDDPPRGFLASGAWKVPLLAVSILLLLAGLAMWFVDQTFDNPPRFLLAGGILLLGIYVALDPEPVLGAVTGRQAVVGGNVLVVAVASLVILGLINVLGTRYSNQWDLSAGQKFTLSAQSVNLVKALPQSVHAVGFFTQSGGLGTDYQQLLSRYAAQSDGKFTYEMIDPNQQPGAAQAAGVTQDGTTVFNMGDKKQTSTGTAENDVDTALVKLVRPPQKLYFTTGHGEHDLQGFDQNGYGQIAQALSGDNYTTATVSLLTTRAVPADANGLVIAGPTSDFTQEEKDAVQAYLNNGGAVLLEVDPTSKADFSGLLGTYGIKQDPGFVVDPQSNLYGADPRVVLVSTYGNSPITQNLSQQVTIFPLTAGFQVPTAPASGISTTNIASSSAQSWANSSTTQVQQAPTDPKGPLPVAVTVDQTLSTPAAASPTPAAAPTDTGAAGATPTQAAQSQAHARLLVVGTSSWVINNTLQAGAANQDMFLAAADWMTNQPNLITVRPPDTTDRSVILTGPQSNIMFLVSVLVLPLAVLSVGAAIWWSRR